MSTQNRVLESKPLQTLTGANSVLEVFEDRLIIRRTDPLATFLPDMFHDVRIIDLDDIVAIYLHDSRYSYSHWMMLILQLTNHKHVSLLYDRKDHVKAEAIKHLIDEAIGRRQAVPPATVS
jgi:hypothetical protein